MCKGTPEVVGVKAHSVNRMYAALIKEQMQLRHTSLRKMADEGGPQTEPPCRLL